jgi:hypothetical protein
VKPHKHAKKQAKRNNFVIRTAKFEPMQEDLKYAVYGLSGEIM